MKVTKQTFQKWTYGLHGMVVDRDNVLHDVWIIDAQCLPGDEAPEVKRAWSVQNNNVDFYLTRTPDRASDFLFHRILGVQALCNIDVGVKVVYEFGSSYDLNC